QVAANAGSAARTASVAVVHLSTTLQSASINQPGTENLVTARIDFDGDGLADALSYDPTTRGWSIAFAAGGAANGVWPLAGLTVQPADLDGDGLTDVFGYNATSGDWLKALNSGSNGFTVFTGTWWPGWRASLFDLDGHGQYTAFLDDGHGGLMTPLTTGIA